MRNRTFLAGQIVALVLVALSVAGLIANAGP